MDTVKLTKVFIIALLALVIGYDVWVVLETTPGDTISEVTLAWALKSPIIPCAVGVVIGHLFWPQYVARDTPPSKE